MIGRTAISPVTQASGLAPKPASPLQREIGTLGSSAQELQKVAAELCDKLRPLFLQQPASPPQGSSAQDAAMSQIPETVASHRRLIDDSISQLQWLLGVLEV